MGDLWKNLVKELPKEVLKQFLENIKNEWDDFNKGIAKKIYPSFSTFIYSWFHFKEAKEWHDYWHLIYRKRYEETKELLKHKNKEKWQQ